MPVAKFNPACHLCAIYILTQGDADNCPVTLALGEDGLGASGAARAHVLFERATPVAAGRRALLFLARSAASRCARSRRRRSTARSARPALLLQLIRVAGA